MIGYGPDLSDDKAMMNQNNEDPDFHPLPPPITTKGTIIAHDHYHYSSHCRWGDEGLCYY